jgi:hypothetical protein
VLSGLFSTAKQDNDFSSGIFEIHSITWAVMSTHFKHSGTDKYPITGITFSKPGNSLYYQILTYTVFEIFKPFFKGIGMAYIFYLLNVNYNSHLVKGNYGTIYGVRGHFV